MMFWDTSVFFLGGSFIYIARETALSQPLTFVKAQKKKDVSFGTTVYTNFFN